MADKTSKSDVLKQLLTHKEKTAGDSAAYATVAYQVKANDALLKSGRRMEAQVDAALRAKYKACGMEDAYQPPDDDDMSPTLINCTFNGDEAVQNISKIIDGIDDGGDGASPPPAKPERNGRWWKWLLGTLLAVTLGAMIVMLAWQLFGDASQYEIVAIEYEPNK